VRERSFGGQTSLDTGHWTYKLLYSCFKESFIFIFRRLDVFLTATRTYRHTNNNILHSTSSLFAVRFSYCQRTFENKPKKCQRPAVQRLSVSLRECKMQTAVHRIALTFLYPFHPLLSVSIPRAGFQDQKDIAPTKHHHILLNIHHRIHPSRYRLGYITNPNQRSLTAMERELRYQLLCFLPSSAD